MTSECRSSPANDLREFAARELGVQRPAGAGVWLLRVFLLPASQAQALPAWITAPWRRLLAALGRKLNLPGAPVAGSLLRRLFLIDTAAAGPGKAASQGAPARLSGLFLFLSGLAAGWRERLARIDLAQLGRRSDRAAGAFGSGSSLIIRLACAVGLALFVVAATTPLGFKDQLLLSLLMFAVACLLRKVPGRAASLALIGLSIMASSRYIWWRMTQTLDLEPVADRICGVGLVCAEWYTWTVLILGYVQSAWPLQRKPLPLPPDSTQWPTVDVFIPTYNEALSVVKPSVLAALSLDWPRDKLKVYILDDGRRAEFREFAAICGAQYIARTDNRHAKAGNLNNALPQTQGEYIAIFDCDHMPVRSFLKTTVGSLVGDPRCALVQTPHHFFSPDPFERNLGTFKVVPNESNLFYGLLQDGNDLWNAAFFCGSCAVLRRSALMEVGGIAVQTVTEDAHTALNLHRRGYNSAYIGIRQAAGLATTSLSAFIRQRTRWARGMAQIFRIDNPMFCSGLNLFQRLCYGNSMLYFFHGLPRLVFLTAPLTYLFFGLHIIHAAALTLLVYALPHLVLSNFTNSKLQGGFRHSFWNEAYETVLAWYIAVPTLLALINPRSGAFNVTSKDELVHKEFFAWRLAAPNLVLALLNIAGVAMAIPRVLYWNAQETPTVLLNVAWSLFNLMWLGAALGVAAESRQVRTVPRVAKRIAARLYLPDGRVVNCAVEDYSTLGLGVKLPAAENLAADSEIRIGLIQEYGEFAFNARIKAVRGQHLGLQLEQLSIEEERQLIQSTFGRSDAWDDWNSATPVDHPLASLREVVSFGFRGYERLRHDIFSRVSEASRKAPAGRPAAS